MPHIPSRVFVVRTLPLGDWRVLHSGDLRDNCRDKFRIMTD